MLYIPNFSCNLVSVSKLTQILYCNYVFDDFVCHIQDKISLKKIGTAELKAGLYTLSPKTIFTLRPDHVKPLHSVHVFNSCTCNKWHLRLGHPSHQKLVELHKIFPFIDYIQNSNPCKTCHISKQRRLPFPNSVSVCEKPFDLLHTDIWGPISSPSMLGHKYFLTIVDDASRYTWLYFMKLKSETQQLIKNFISYVETQFDTKIKGIRTDNGYEFKLTQYYSSKGIVHQTSCVETPQQNGIIERKHQHILAITRALLFQSSLPKVFWTRCSPCHSPY